MGDDEMARQPQPYDVDSDVPGQLHVQQRQRDRQSFAVVDHFVQVTVRAVVIVAAAAVKAVFLEQILAKRCQLHLRRGVRGQLIGDFAGHVTQFVHVGVDVEFLVVESGDQQSRSD